MLFYPHSFKIRNASGWCKETIGSAHPHLRQRPSSFIILSASVFCFLLLSETDSHPYVWLVTPSSTWNTHTSSTRWTSQRAHTHAGTWQGLHSTAHGTRHHCEIICHFSIRCHAFTPCTGGRRLTLRALLWYLTAFLVSDTALST